MRFELDADQIAKLRAWEAEQDATALADQKAARAEGGEGFGGSFGAMMNEELGEPYYGCSGGSLTFKFTPTSIGTIAAAIHGWTKKEVDLTDYDSW